MRCSSGARAEPGPRGPRLADWALAGTASPRHFLLIRRLISRPDQLTFYLCYAPQGRSATMTYFIAIAGRRWPVEETFKTGKDVLGWDQCQARTWDAICRHTALAALAQLRHAAIRNALCGDITLPPPLPGTVRSSPPERMSKIQASTMVPGNPLASTTTTALSVHSGRCSPCITGS